MTAYCYRILKCRNFNKKIYSVHKNYLADRRTCSSNMNTTFDNGFASDDDLWIFGYGSLVWKADFPFEEKRTGYIKGFLRRFYQNSVDHRGTEQQPGRVVTLVRSQDPESKVWGMGYRIARCDSAEVLRHLDHREKNGYDRHSVPFYPHPRSETQTNEPKSIILYVATQNNPSFAGQHDSLEEIATQISNASGVSGKNPEYVYKLAEAMRQLYPGEEDEHLFRLEKLVRSIDGDAILRHSTGICDTNHISDES